MDGAAQAVVGEWVLKSARFEFADDGQAIDIYGPSPAGRLIVSDAGRFTVFITAADRGAADDFGAMFKSMIAYAGDYVIEGDTFVVQVDLASPPAWVGTEQVRFFEVKDDALSLHTAPLNHPGFSNRAGVSRFRFERAA